MTHNFSLVEAGTAEDAVVDGHGGVVVEQLANLETAELGRAARNKRKMDERMSLLWQAHQSHVRRALR